MVRLYDISDWNEQSWFNTGGTRDKKIYLNPKNNKLYYFKQSFKKGQRDYKYEFWSEIIASEIGLLLNIDILKYHIAVRNDIVGCLSKTMIESESEELIEGGKYLQAFDNTFNPSNTKIRNQYDFSLIVESLFAFKKDSYLSNLIETIIFDALIGNSDRHQENWAIINIHTSVSESLKQIEGTLESENLETLPVLLKKVLRSIYTVKGKLRPEIKKARLMLPQKTRFAPIYDSGCSFGRELSDERVEKLLNDEAEIRKYVMKGQSEIHWEQKKYNHFELIQKLIDNGYKVDVIKALRNIVRNYDENNISIVVNNVDKTLLKHVKHYQLPESRKKLILKLLTLRFKKLKGLYLSNI